MKFSTVVFCDTNRQTAVIAYFSNDQLLLFAWPYNANNILTMETKQGFFQFEIII